jgi:hypothetical protein
MGIHVFILRRNESGNQLAVFGRRGAAVRRLSWSAAVAGLDDHVGLRLVRVRRSLILLAGRPVQLVAVDTLAMENRSPVTAVQQLFADTATALVANIQHK